MRLALCLVLVLSVLALQADAGRSRVDVLIQKLLRTQHEAPAPASSQSGGSIQSTQSGTPAGGASVNSAGSVSNTISAVSPNNFPSASSAASSSGALQPGSVAGSASVSAQAPASVSAVSSGSSAAPAKPKPKKGSKGRLTVVSNINVMNSKARGVNKASADLALMTEQNNKNAQEGRQKSAENNRAQIEAEDVIKKDKQMALAQEKVNEFNKKQTIIEESQKADVAAANKAAEEAIKEKKSEKEESTKAKEKADEETAKAAAAAAAKSAAEEQKQKADAAEATKQEEAKKAAAQAKEQADKAAQVAKEQDEKKKAEEKAKAAQLEEKTKAEAKTKQEETAKAKYILKPSPFKVTKANKIGDATGSAAYTLTFWYKPEGKGSDFTNIIHHGDDDFSRGPAVYMFPDSSQLHICSAGKADKDWNQCVDPEPLPQPGVWTHVAIIHKLDGIYVLYNGEQVARLADSGPKGIAGPVYAGSPFAEPAPASLSDVRWVADALTVDDIKVIYKQAKNSPGPAF